MPSYSNSQKVLRLARKYVTLNDLDSYGERLLARQSLEKALNEGAKSPTYDYFYLASPYSDPSSRVRHKRWKDVSEVMVRLMNAGIMTHSPIACWHHIAKTLNLSVDHTTYQRLDETMLLNSGGMVIFQMQGWEDSKGIESEKKFCFQHKIPVFVLRQVDYLMDQEATVRHLAKTIANKKAKERGYK